MHELRELIHYESYVWMSERERYWRDPTTLRNSLASMEAEPSDIVRLVVVESVMVASFAPAILVRTRRSYIFMLG
jgi:hypothetical protein